MLQPQPRRRTVLIIVVTLLLPPPSISSDHDAAYQQPTQHLYEQALALRYVVHLHRNRTQSPSNSTDAKTPRERQRNQARIAELLHEAAGATIVPRNATLDYGWQVAPAVTFSEHSHAEALWELAQAYTHGTT